MNDREKQFWMLVIGIMFLSLIALTFTTRKPWYLVTLGTNGSAYYQFPSEASCLAAKKSVDGKGIFVLVKCSEGK